MKNLGEFLDDDLNEVYRMVVSLNNQKYDVVKERVIEHVERMRLSVNYRKKSRFEEACMKKGERVDLYAHRLETLARKKFGDKDINENKELMKKFISTVPDKVAAVINAKRKEKKKWTGLRLMWKELLELLEDERFDERGEGKSVYVGGRSEEYEERSYRDILIAEEMRSMKNLLQECLQQNNRGRSRERNVYTGNRWNQDRSASARRERSASRGRQNSMNSRNEWNRMNGMNRRREVKCFRCNKFGHVRNECRWALGSCFGCGSSGHRVNECPNPRVLKCFECGGAGHRANDCRMSGRGQQQQGGNVCGNCGERGHYSRMCQKPRSKCDNCGMDGHVAAVCRNRVQGGSQGN